MLLFPWIKTIRSEPCISLMLSIQPMRPLHLEGVLAIERASFDLAWSDHQFQLMMASPKHVANVAIMGGVVIGYLIAKISDGSTELVNLAIHPRFRRRQLGRSLVVQQILALGKHPHRAILASVSERNLDSQLFFRSLGFRAISIARKWFDDGQDAYVFQFRIGDHETPAYPELRELDLASAHELTGAPAAR